MCELTVEIIAPYNITLLIDGKYCRATENGLYKINLDAKTQHCFEIYVEKLDFKITKHFDRAVSIFKFKERHTDTFENVFYRAKFSLSKNHSTAKIVFKYNKFTTLNFEKKETPVAYIGLLRKSKIEITNEEKSVFKNKKDVFIHFLRHRWIEIIIAIIIIAVLLANIFKTFYENQNNLQYAVFYASGFATTPFERIIELSVDLLLWTMYWVIGNILFIKRSLKISNWTKDEDDKSNFFYKTKFFI